MVLAAQLVFTGGTAAGSRHTGNAEEAVLLLLLLVDGSYGSSTSEAC